MFNKIRKSRISKVTALTLIVLLLTEIAIPNAAFALTSGPSQPEVQSFEPIATTDMVDLFTGDFNYNIPIMQVGHYPINMFYHAGIGMDQEASWTGLGWNINPGVINRNMRGLPDDFKGDLIEKTLNIKSDLTIGVKVGIDLEALGYDFGHEANGMSANFSLYFNNYKGIGYSHGIGATRGNDNSSLSLNISLDSQQGIDMSLEGMVGKNGSKNKFKGGLGLGYNSRSGLKSLTLSMSKTEKKKDHKNKKSSSSLLSFVAPTFTPSVTPGMGSFFGSFKFAAGTQTQVVLAGVSIGAYVHVNGLMQPTKNYPTAGYLYAENNKLDNVLQDINRDKEVEVNKFTKQMHTTNHAYDTYAVSGQGTGGMYRPYRGNVGMVFDPVTDNKNWEGFTGAELSGGIELGGGPSLVEIGGDINVGVSLSYMGPWKESFEAFDQMQFTNNPQGTDIFHEPVYFKTVGEKTAVNQQYFDKMLDTKAVRFLLNDQFVSAKARDIIIPDEGPGTSLPVGLSRTERDRRNQNISYLTAEEASMVGFDRELKFYDDAGERTETRYNTERLKHHVSEIIVTNPDGTRYVYGLPAYNYTQEEYTFAVDLDNGNTLNATTGLVTYDDSDPATSDISTKNKKGRDHYFSKEVTPAYAYAYMLTAVLSPDYMDVNNDGISDDDWGTYTKINYYRAHKDFQWRTPVEAGKANYNRAMKSDTKDDKASLIYGKKEIWYVHSIETKTHKAEFALLERSDGKGVAGVNGGDGTQSLYQLDKITLYSKPDRTTNEGDAIPIKTAHFDYTNDLCDGIPNGTDGKLTLKGLHFTYGNNTSGALSPYKFEYLGEDPTYNIKGSDRWGSYKPNNPSLPNWEFPYSTQDESDANLNASAWNLTDIHLPSGGHINVQYESDDYAYVQDKRAGIMTTVTAVTADPIHTSGESLYDFHEPHNFIHFNIPAGQTVADMVEGIDKLYFNFDVKLAKDGKEETISGYAGVGAYGDDASHTIGWVEIKPVDIETGVDFERDVNPIAMAAWQFTRNYRPGIAYEGSDWTETEQGNMSPTDVVWGILSSVSSICNMIAGFNQMMEAKGKGRLITPQKSWIRLNAPKSGKFGGGHRVKQIEFSDTWDDMTGNNEPVAIYGQTFAYTNPDGTTSGVAAYEPLIGGDENACRLPVAHYAYERMLGPDDDHYVEGPFGEQFFPAATVGYEKVTVRNITPEGVHRHGTGTAVHEFYTAKEFPVYTDDTKYDIARSPINPIFSFLAVYTIEYATVTQGYAIELNDMHGKQKQVTIYPEVDPVNPPPTQTPISQVSYHYKVDPITKRLDNTVNAMDKAGMVSQEQVGKDIEMVIDSKEKSDYHSTAGIQINVDVFMAGPLPFVIPIPWPDVSISERRLRYAVNTKVINRFGILERTEATQNGGATITTWNDVYDKETGEVLLTRTVNEHNDKVLNPDNDLIYNFNYPAHWAYDRMGPAYQNTGVHVKDRLHITGGNGVADLNLPTDNDIYNAFVKGDEVMLYTGDDITTAIKAWVLDKDINDGYISFIDMNGENIDDGDYNFKIIRSGRRNQQSVSIGSVVSKQTPITDDVISIGTTTEIINSSATVFSEEWQTPGDKGVKETITYTCDLGTDGDDFIDLLIEMQGLTSPFDTDGQVWIPDVPDFLAYEPCETLKYTCTPVTSEEITGNSIHIDFHYYDCDIAGNPSLQGCNIFILLPPGIYAEDIISISDEISYTNETTLPNVLYPAFLPELEPGWTLQQFHLTISTLTNAYIVEGIVSGTSGLGTESHCAISFNKNCNNSTSIAACGPGETEFVNPYLTGLRGIWRPQKGYAYNSTRHYSGVNNALESRTDGTYTDFTPFWTPNTLEIGDEILALDWQPPIEINNPDPVANKWVWTSEVTKYHPGGFEVENKDALGRYSSALFNYWYTEPSAVASNAQYREIAFDGFEDYRFQEGYGPGTCHYLDHWSFMDAIIPDDDLNPFVFHTGKRSLELEADGDPGSNLFSVVREIVPEPTGNHDDFMTQYELKDIDKLGLFSPINTKKYVLGMWVNKYDPDVLQTYGNIKINVRFLDDDPTPNIISQLNFDAASTQPVIENWKRFEATFDVPEDDPFDPDDNVKYIEVEIVNENETNAVYVDDIRIHPFNSNMKTFVYDPVSLRLTAQLDENNYATFYEYDDQGNLIRTKKETERGIVTLQENRQNIHKIIP